MPWRLEHTYATLPQLFYSRVDPTPVRDPQLVVFNVALAERLGLDVDALIGEGARSGVSPHHFTGKAPGPFGRAAAPFAGGAGPLDREAVALGREASAFFSGNALPPGAQPIAQAYAGHQFGHFTGLGDGRAILLGEQVAPDGIRFDVQLKGSGQTPYSRRGDGRAALGPMLREYIISEAMHALGIPTTRSLAVVTTGEPVFRESVLPGAVLTRIAASHIRVGSFEWAAAHRDIDALRALSDYTRRRHYPEIEDGPDAHFALFTAIIERQARLIAQWQLVGFIHGVMNTDNMALSGETIDYGPCAFMDTYHPETVFSSIDTGGRYAYGNQPAIAQWNLARLAEAMLSLFDDDSTRAVERATEALHRFADLFAQHWRAGMRAKLGLFDELEGDNTLVNDLLAWMQRRQADFTNTFRALTSGAGDLASSDGEFAAWHARLVERRALQQQSAEEAAALMRRSNPAFIPRNHKVEEALAAAAAADLAVMQRLLDVLATPYDHHRDAPAYAEAGRTAASYQTFCGT